MSRVCRVKSSITLVVLILLQVAYVSSAQILDSSSGQRPGELPDFHLCDDSGRSRHSSEFMVGPTLITFVIEGCSACDLFLNKLSSAAQKTTSLLKLVIIAPTLSETLVSQINALLPGATILVDSDYEVGRAFGVQQAPSAYLFNNGIGFGLIPWRATGDEISKYVGAMVKKETVGPTSHSTLVSPGDRLPAIDGFDQLGTHVTIERFEKPTLLVFSSVYCHSCITAVEELSEIVDTSSFDILTVNRENCEVTFAGTNRWHLSTLCDNNGQTFSRFGVWGTPTFVLAHYDQVLDVWVGRTPRVEEVHSSLPTLRDSVD